MAIKLISKSQRFSIAKESLDGMAKSVFSAFLHQRALLPHAPSSQLSNRLTLASISHMLKQWISWLTLAFKNKIMGQSHNATLSIQSNVSGNDN